MITITWLGRYIKGKKGTNWKNEKNVIKKLSSHLFCKENAKNIHIESQWVNYLYSIPKYVYYVLLK